MNQRNVSSLLRPGIAVIICLLSVVAQKANAARVEVAEELLVDLRSEDLAPGSVSEWPNRGSLGGVFTAFGNAVAETVGDWEGIVVSFDGETYFDGPASPAGITGGETRSVEVWAYNIGESKEECMVAWSHRGGPDGTNMTFNYGWKDFGAAGHWGDAADMAWEGFDNAEGGTGGYPPLENWWHLVYTYDRSTIRLYVNGELNNERAAALKTHVGDLIRIGGQNNGDGSAALGEKAFTGAIAQVRIHNGVLTPEQVQNNAKIRIENVGHASNPMPKDGNPDVPLRDLMLSWEPGLYPGTHTVYFSEDMDAVESGTAEADSGLDIASYDPGLLSYDTTYYWRVDEVNDSPDKTVHEGKIWDFTIEPKGYPIANVIATASASDAGAGPENTVNGSGLNAEDQHSVDNTTMWLGSADGANPVWLQYEFDRVYKLHEMRVWNYNVIFEPVLGFGLKDVTIEHSTDGAEWMVLGDVELAQGTAQEGYEANSTVDLAGVAAMFVRITVNSNYSGLSSYGLSEVRFSQIPAMAREPQPEAGASEVGVDTMLSWRAGREAAWHDVYLGTDADALTLADSIDEASHNPGSLDLATTYFWRVDEVNEAEAISLWQGDVWDFTTQRFLVVDDFEGYTDAEGNRIYESWIDGFGVDENGSTVGHLEAPFAETTIVNSGRQAMPLFYDNTGASISETELTLSQDWTVNGVKSLSLHFHGAADNDGQLYVKINGTKIVYDGDAADISKPIWQAWNIDLSGVAGDVSGVTSLMIGMEGTGASGVIYIDDVRLQP